jgi:hypothetical protein
LERVRLQQQAGEEGREGVQGRAYEHHDEEGQVTGPPCAALLLSQTLRDEGSMGPWRAFWPSMAAVPVATLATQYAKVCEEREREKRRDETDDTSFPHFVIMIPFSYADVSCYFQFAYFYRVL